MIITLRSRSLPLSEFFKRFAKKYNCPRVVKETWDIFLYKDGVSIKSKTDYLLIEKDLELRDFLFHYLKTFVNFKKLCETHKIDLDSMEEYFAIRRTKYSLQVTFCKAASGRIIDHADLRDGFGNREEGITQCRDFSVLELYNKKLDYVEWKYIR